ncbi:hypothetical protein FO519_005493 [Halicephalobus sp. NKZ332]|nr:hypothetical protein FO519_005493 [Halicephalobus sp. NKZ332]
MKPGDIGHTLSQGEDVLGVLVIEEGLVVQRTGGISDSLANYFVKMVNVGLSSQLVEEEQFQTMNINYPIPRYSYTIAMAGKRIYVVKKSMPSHSDDDDEPNS